MPNSAKTPDDIAAAYKSLGAILDGIDALVYVSDMQTYELIFMNKYGRDAWGEYRGRRCYEVLQAGQDSPCTFCTNRFLVDDQGQPTGVYSWDFQNTVNQHWYQCRDQAITWVDGRVVRLEIAADISDRVQMEQALKAAKEYAETLARTDELTQLRNRRAVFEEGQRAVDLARRFKHPLSAVLLDVDHFKQINDKHGHALGDRVLQMLAKTIAGNVRSVDVFGRIGGEEFALILPQTGIDAAAGMAEKLRRLVGDIRVPAAGAPLSLSCSFGVAELGTEHPGFDALLNSADKALYRAKTGGRNRVSC